MEILNMIQLHEENTRKVIYDFSTGKYYQNYERQRADNTNYWLLLQPFVIAGVELVQRMLMDYSMSVRRIGGLIIFAVGIAVCVAAWEFYLSKGTKELRHTMREIKKPDLETLNCWADDISRRLKNAAIIGCFAGVIIMVFVALFLYLGTPLMLTLALSCFCIAYFILSSGRPWLLRKYLKNYKEM